MSVMNADLMTEVNRFRRSSSFTPGDTFSFSIKLNDDLSLPGKFDPAGYLNTIGFVAAKRVAVVCAANGGLCAELVRRGAEVVAFEPRNQYFKALAGVADFFGKATGKNFKVNLRMPDHTDGQFDLIVWPEGMEDIRDPLNPLLATVARLAPEGRMFVEVTHGQHKDAPAKNNSWKPTEASFVDTVSRNKDCMHVRSFKGRHGNRQIHEFKSFFLAPKPGSECAKVETLQAPSPDTMQEIAKFSEDLKAKLLAATGVPKAVLDQPQVAVTTAPTAPAPAETTTTDPQKGKRARKSR